MKHRKESSLTVGPDGFPFVTLRFGDGSSCPWPPKFGEVPACPNGCCKLVGMIREEVTPGDATLFMQAHAKLFNRATGKRARA